MNVLVNACASTERGTILDTTPDLFDRMFAINASSENEEVHRASRFLRIDEAAERKMARRLFHPVRVAAFGGLEQPFVVRGHTELTIAPVMRPPSSRR